MRNALNGEQRGNRMDGRKKRMMETDFDDYIVQICYLWSDGLMKRRTKLRRMIFYDYLFSSIC